LERIRELIDILNKASEAYYVNNEEIMPNYEYDMLYDELVRLEEETGTVYPDSPTVNVGYRVVGSLTKVAHEQRMLSLDKTKDPAQLKDFLADKEGVLSWKLDGLTIVLKYDGGRLIQAITRGNGEIGEDVTHNAVHFAGVPASIDYSGAIAFRGEAVISYSEFEKINEKLEESVKYKNPRNLCSGTVRQLDSAVLKERKVEFNLFSVMTEDASVTKDSKSAGIEWASNQGFIPAYYKMVNGENVEEAVLWFKEQVGKNNLPSDGLVLTLDSISYSASLGSTSKFPKDSVALKWEDETALTKLVEINWNTSRTGLINPIAIFEPVELEGTTVNRASLHNLSIVMGLELGIGDEIRVYKANMIIPQVADNLTRSNTFEAPDKCSVCGGETEIVAQNGIRFLYCTNPNCKAQQVKALTHFVSRDAMNIEGFSEATVEKFVDKGFTDNYLDIFSLHEKQEEIMAMEGFGEKSANNLLASIEKSKTCMLHNFIYALGINHIGLVGAKLLCGNFDYDFSSIINAKEEELTLIDGFGSIMAHAVTNYFSGEKNRSMAEDAFKLLNIQRPRAESAALSGKTFVITGSLERFENRKALQSYIERIGGKVASAVSSNTDYLINNDVESSSSKNKKARELGVEIISEEKFIEAFGRN